MKALAPGRYATASPRGAAALLLPRLLALLAAARPAAAATVGAVAGSARPNPVTRVVSLLEGLAQQIEIELKNEQDLYDKFACWSKTFVESRTMANEKAQSRKDSLTAYVADLDAGRIELTSERVDLEREIGGYTTDIETAEMIRAKDHDDYLAADAEMAKAIAALENATQVLNAVQDEGQSSGLLALRGTVNQGFSERAADAEALSHAVEFGQRFLSQGDARFLQRLLTGDVPTKDWKKLNRQAEFKMSYKARSTKILAVITKLLETFRTSKIKADAKEAQAVSAHEALMKSKGALKASATTALQNMAVEGAAQQLSKSEANAEVSALATQIERDEQLIGETKQALEDKKQEWKDRKALRLAEIEAINKAIAILRSDDARDLFKRSLHSQGYAFLEVAGRRSQGAAAWASMRRHSAAEVVRSAARATQDQRLVALAKRLTLESGGRFDKVIQAIDAMVSTLETEGDTDLANKQQCENDRSQDTDSAKTASRAIDDFSDTIAKNSAEIKQIEDQIEEKRSEIEQIEQAMDKANATRVAEHSAWLATDKDDEAASETVQSAIKVLEDFYSQQAAFAQARSGQPSDVPPPPPTWDEPYTGKKEESQGIVAILQMLHADIVQDRSQAKSAEDKSETAHANFTSDSNQQISTISGSIGDLTTAKGQKVGSVSTAKTDRDSKRGELKVVLKRLKDAAPDCDFYTVNFAARAKNRQIEIDGLKRAKGILEGAFSL